MFAIFRKNGKQYRVAQGETVRLDRVKSEPGEVLEIDEVLAIKEKNGELKCGCPIIVGAKVIVTVVKHGKDKKIVVFKRKRRKTYRRKYGHRQSHTIVRIDSIRDKEIPSQKSKLVKDDTKVAPLKKDTSKKTKTKKAESEGTISKKVIKEATDTKKVLPEKSITKTPLPKNKHHKKIKT